MKRKQVHDTSTLTTPDTRAQSSPPPEYRLGSDQDSHGDVHGDADDRSDDEILQLPSDHFYWAVLESNTDGAGSTRMSVEQLGYMFERTLPEPIESVHARFIPVRHKRDHRRRHIALGLPARQLEDLDTEQLQVLAPGTVPEFVQQALRDAQSGRDPDDVSADDHSMRPDPLAMNLLTGRFTPPLVRTARRRTSQTAMALVLGLALVSTAGLLRRAAAIDSDVRAFDQASTSLIDQALNLDGETQSSSSAQLPRRLQLTALQRRLEQTRGEDLGALRSADVALTLTSVLENWPADVHLETSSVIVTDRNITIQTITASAADAQRLADALSRIPEWTIAQPQVRTLSNDRVQTTVRLTADASSGANTGAPS